MNREQRVALVTKEVVSKMMDRVVENDYCSKSLHTTGNIRLGRLKRIQQVLNNSYHKNYEFDWQKEIIYILAARGQLLPITINCDIFIHMKRMEDDFNLELKDSKLDIYKIRAIKEEILKLIVISHSCK